jgi:CDGSH-type Zn-finger protein
MTGTGKAERKPRIKVVKDGPLIVTGNVPLGEEIVVRGPDGEPSGWKKGPSFPDRSTYALCRCGASKSKPFCDGRHVEAAFDGTETARREPSLENAEKTIGPGVDLTWSEDLCNEACFCHRGEGAWAYAEGSADAGNLEKAVEEACACPSGSLVAWDKATGAAIEPVWEPGISLIEEPRLGTSGPIWVKGGIPVESVDGAEYERRNRVTLCRCGLSRKKPICDGAHLEAGFNSKP